MGAERLRAPALTRRSYDPAGVLAITGALVLLVYAVIKAPAVRPHALRAIVSTVAVSRSASYLAAHTGANPLVVLTEGYRSAFVACAVLAGIGLALALLLPGRPR